MAFTEKGMIEEITKSLTLYGTKNYLAVTVDLSEETYNTVATHEILTVTGLVRLRILPVVTVDGDDTTGDTANISLGHESDTDNFIAATDVDDLAAGELWLNATPTEVAIDFTSIIDKIVNGVDVGYEITGEAATAGTIVFHCWWEPLDANGNVVAGDGSAMV
jgi:hypothetical protein